MGFGITKVLRKIQIAWNVNEFTIRRKILGFENANAFLRRLDKNSIIPILKINGAVIGTNCDIESPLIFHNCVDFSNLIIGNNCHIGKNCFLDLRGKIILENNIVVSMQTSLITHVDMERSSLRSNYPITSANVILKDNCYIGANSTILMGVTINECGFVAAGSVVIKSVASSVMVGGVPAKEIKKIVFK